MKLVRYTDFHRLGSMCFGFGKGKALSHSRTRTVVEKVCYQPVCCKWDRAIGGPSVRVQSRVWTIFWQSTEVNVNFGWKSWKYALLLLPAKQWPVARSLSLWLDKKFYKREWTYRHDDDKIRRREKKFLVLSCGVFIALVGWRFAKKQKKKAAIPAWWYQAVKYS